MELTGRVTAMRRCIVFKICYGKEALAPSLTYLFKTANDHTLSETLLWRTPAHREAGKKRMWTV